MSTAMRGFVLLVAIGIIPPGSARAQFNPGPWGNGCPHCQPVRPCCPQGQHYGSAQPAVPHYSPPQPRVQHYSPPPPAPQRNVRHYAPPPPQPRVRNYAPPLPPQPSAQNYAPPPPPPQRAVQYHRPSPPVVQQYRRPQPVIAAPATPAISTQYRQQQIVTYRDVPTVEYRREAQIATVPVTAFRDVLVDQGSYQTVWVPKLVTQRTAQTVYQQRLSYRTVPYQVNRRIPQVSTRLVPQQTLRYVPQTAWAVSGPIGPLTISTVPIYAPGTATLPPLAVTSVRTAQKSSKSKVGPVPDPKFMEPPLADDYDEWSTVRARKSSTQADERMTVHRIARPSERPTPARSASGTNSLFVPAPSAATVWQTRRWPVRR